MSKPEVAANITVQLVGEAVIALDSTAQLTGLCKTDVVNQALQTFAYFKALQDSGGALYIRETPTSPTYRAEIRNKGEIPSWAASDREEAETSSPLRWWEIAYWTVALTFAAVVAVVAVVGITLNLLA